MGSPVRGMPPHVVYTTESVALEGFLFIQGTYHLIYKYFIAHVHPSSHFFAILLGIMKKLSPREKVREKNRERNREKNQIRKQEDIRERTSRRNSDKQEEKVTVKKVGPRKGSIRTPKTPFSKSSTAGAPAISKTSWGNEAQWYSDHLEAGDTYHAKVVLPNLLRVVDPKLGMKILEIGCGEGFFSRALAHTGALVTASDISPELIELAKKKGGKLTYRVSPAESLDWVAPHSQEVVVAVLTLQNMEHIEKVFDGVARSLVPGGRFYMVLNHPTFRIPKVTSWGYDAATLTQYRRVDAYLTPRREKIDMHPGKKGSASVTYSYHRSLQDYMKALRHTGFAITRLEEWISHKTSEPGPRASAENTSRREFPLFMLIEATRIH